MEKLEFQKRIALGKRLAQQSQAQIMSEISQFTHTEHIDGPAYHPMPDRMLYAAVFNLERGTYADACADFLLDCPDCRPVDLIFANELDDGCIRSGGGNTTRVLAERLGMHAVFGLEFVELSAGAEEKGFHGNALLSRWPIVWSEVLRLPEAYNWYFDRQTRIGGRCAVFARLDLGDREIGAVSVHLENRTDGIGRREQMQAVLKHAARVFDGLPVIIGGDLNTNTFDGRDTDVIRLLADNPEICRSHLEEMTEREPVFEAARIAGYAWQPASAMTRRKPLPDGRTLELQLDWILYRGVQLADSRIASTRADDWTFTREGEALKRFSGQQLSDHNVVWAKLYI